MTTRKTKKPRWTPAEEHRMAMVSAYSVIQEHGKATVSEVCSRQGLVEIRAKKALEDLVKARRLTKSKRGVYFLKS